MVLVLKLRSLPVNFRRTQKLALRGIEDRALRDYIQQRRRRPLDRQRISISPAQTRTGDQLRDEVVAQFPVGGKGALHVGIGNRRPCTMRQGQPNGAIQRQRLGLAARSDRQCSRKKRE